MFVSEKNKTIRNLVEVIFVLTILLNSLVLIINFSNVTTRPHTIALWARIVDETHGLITPSNELIFYF